MSYPFSNSNWTGKSKKWKIENEKEKTLQSELLRSISDILQSAVYWCCPSYPLRLSCLVRWFSSISQNRKNIFFIVLRQARVLIQYVFRTLFLFIKDIHVFRCIFQSLFIFNFTCSAFHFSYSFLPFSLWKILEYREGSILPMTLIHVPVSYICSLPYGSTTVILSSGSFFR